MKGDLKRAWVKALRGRGYRQTRKVLNRKGNRKAGKRSTYCCLGVLCRVAGAQFDITGRAVFPSGNITNVCTLSIPVLDELGLSHVVADKLMGMNDNYGNSFKEIADWVEKNL